MSDIDFLPPVRDIPIQHRSVGLRLYADGFKRALSHFLSGRKLHDAVEEIDRVTMHVASHSDLTSPMDDHRPLRNADSNLLDRVTAES